MERITEHIDYCFLACYERQGDKIREECPIYKCCYSRQMHEKLSHYEDLEEQGRLIELPCALGTTVYSTRWWDDVDEKVKVDGKTYYRRVHKHKITKEKFTLHDANNFGKCIFLTKEEAETKLKELKEGVE